MFVYKLHFLTLLFSLALAKTEATLAPWTWPASVKVSTRRRSAAAAAADLGIWGW